MAWEMALVAKCEAIKNDVVCGHVWLVRGHHPDQCPHCKSWKWNLGKVKKSFAKKHLKDLEMARTMQDAKKDLLLKTSAERVTRLECALLLSQDAMAIFVKFLNWAEKFGSSTGSLSKDVTCEMKRQSRFGSSR